MLTDHNATVNLLDCSFRDGGYYNNWSFKIEDINFYLSKISKTKIKYIEIGFRFIDKKKLGLTAYSDDNFLQNLKINKNLRIGVMINASDFAINHKLDLKKLIITFPNKKNLAFVRIAFNLIELELVIKLVNFFNKKKINVIINLMQISEIKSKEMMQLLQTINKLNIEVFYVADSLGSLTKQKITKISKILKKNCKIKIGFHAHDNISLAFKNAKIAIKNQFDFIDCTMLGMGRGAGNLKTEEIYSYLFKKDKIGILNIQKINQNIFIKLKQKYNWGPNLYYNFAAKNSIHPTYVQELLNNQIYPVKSYKIILKSLAKINSKKFDPENLIQYTKNTNYDEIKNKEDYNIEKNKCLIVGSSPVLKKYKKKIYNFSKKNSLLNIAVNTNKTFDNKFFDYRVASHPKRIQMDYMFYSSLYNKFIIPVKKINPTIISHLKKKKLDLANYSLEISRNKKIQIRKDGCILPSNLVLGYSLSLAISMGMTKIYLAGFGHFEKDSLFKDESASILRLFTLSYPKISIISLTPSSLKIKYINL